MISFDLTPKQKQLRDMARWLAKDRIRPISMQADADNAVPESFLQEVHGMGLQQGAVLEDEGQGTKNKKTGERQTNRTSVLMSEEMAWGDPAVVMSFPGPGLGGPPVRFMGTPEQRDRFNGIFKGKTYKYGAYALTEPSCGSDAKAIKTSARQDGNHYVLNGRKCFITNGARAEWVVVFATIDP
jgi:acyl-CoA dehydrogenase